MHNLLIRLLYFPFLTFLVLSRIKYFSLAGVVIFLIIFLASDTRVTYCKAFSCLIRLFYLLKKLHFKFRM